METMNWVSKRDLSPSVTGFLLEFRTNVQSSLSVLRLQKPRMVSIAPCITMLL